MKTLPKSVLLGQAWPTLAQPKSFHILTQPTGPARTFPRFPILVTNTSTLLKFSIRYQSQVSNWIGEFFKLGLAVVQICGGIQFNHVQRSRVTDLSGIGNERPHPGEQVSREAEEYLQNRRRFEQELRIGSRKRRRDAETEKEMSEHDRKRQIELKLLVLEEKFIDQGCTDAEIAGKLDEARKSLFNEIDWD